METPNCMHYLMSEQNWIYKVMKDWIFIPYIVLPIIHGPYIVLPIIHGDATSSMLVTCLTNRKIWSFCVFDDAKSIYSLWLRGQEKWFRGKVSLSIPADPVLYSVADWTIQKSSLSFQPNWLQLLSLQNYIWDRGNCWQAVMEALILEIGGALKPLVIKLWGGIRYHLSHLSHLPHSISLCARYCGTPCWPVEHPPKPPWQSFWG
jgi:hypothetical protein